MAHCSIYRTDRNPPKWSRQGLVYEESAQDVLYAEAQQRTRRRFLLILPLYFGVRQKGFQFLVRYIGPSNRWSRDITQCE